MCCRNRGASDQKPPTKAMSCRKTKNLWLLLIKIERFWSRNLGNSEYFERKSKKFAFFNKNLDSLLKNPQFLFTKTDKAPRRNWKFFPTGAAFPDGGAWPPWAPLWRHPCWKPKVGIPEQYIWFLFLFLEAEVILSFDLDREWQAIARREWLNFLWHDGMENSLKDPY